MTAEQFAYWLKGYTELTAGQLPTPEQWKLINEHLKTVFVKVTPPLGGGGMPGRVVGPNVASPALRHFDGAFDEFLRRRPVEITCSVGPGPSNPISGAIC